MFLLQSSNIDCLDFLFRLRLRIRISRTTVRTSRVAMLTVFRRTLHAFNHQIIMRYAWPLTLSHFSSPFCFPDALSFPSMDVQPSICSAPSFSFEVRGLSVLRYAVFRLRDSSHVFGIDTVHTLACPLHERAKPFRRPIRCPPADSQDRSRFPRPPRPTLRRIPRTVLSCLPLRTPRRMDLLGPQKLEHLCPQTCGKTPVNSCAVCSRRCSRRPNGVSLLVYVHVDDLSLSVRTMPVHSIIPAFESMLASVAAVTIGAGIFPRSGQLRVLAVHFFSSPVWSMCHLI